MTHRRTVSVCVCAPVVTRGLNLAPEAYTTRSTTGLDSYFSLQNLSLLLLLLILPSCNRDYTQFEQHTRAKKKKKKNLI